MLTALVTFFVTYLAIAGRILPFIRLDRPTAAMCGAVAMVALGVIGLEDAYRAIDLDVIALLLGVMILAAYLVQAQVFRFTGWWVLTRARSARSLLWALVFVSGGLSALLVNDTICLMLTPLVVTVVRAAGLPPLPYLLALASATNIGGVVTFTGNPQNMLIGNAAAGNPSYLTYLGLTLPVGVACLALDAALLSWMFRRVLPAGPLARADVDRPALDRRLALVSVSGIGIFVALALAGVSLAGAAMTAAALLFLVARVPPRRVLDQVDWPLLLFFAGLFVLVGGVAHTGALAHAFAWLAPWLTRGMAGDAALVGATVLGSNLVSNVPFVLVALSWVSALPDPAWGYTLLAVSSTLAGNLTLFGSVANIIVFELAGPDGHIGYLRFLRYGVVITALTLAVAMAILWAERALFAGLL